MKKHNLIKHFLTLALAFVFCGCSSLSYVGYDYTSANVSGVSTGELFFFNAYKKSVTDNIYMRAGVTEAPIEGVLVAYIELQNASVSSYTVNPTDISIYEGTKTAELITAQQY